MEFTPKLIAGALLFIGAAKFMVLLIVAEALFPGYSVSANYISDLGVNPASAWIFNSAILFFGALAILASYFTFRAFGDKLFSALLALSGIGAAGVGIFTESALSIHLLVATTAFLFGGLSAIATYRIAKPPFSWFSAILGLFSLVALALQLSGNYLGLGVGGMERMVAYPILIWAVAFGGYLMESSKS